MPPPIIRRALCTPLLFALTLLALVLLPPSLLGGPRTRVARFVRFAATWGTLECAAVLACGRLWLRRAPADRYYGVVRRYVAGLDRAARRDLGLRIEVEGRWDGARGGPLIVLSRHAGPGDALLLVHHLLTGYGRRPRVVMKAALQLDPCVDLAGNRLPNAFVTPGQGTAPVERLATGLGRRDALVIFPEGGNFTPGRRHRAIRRLTRQNRRREAARAARMTHLMPPRPGGVLAALAAAPAADVVFVAHAGLQDMITVADIWRRVPLTTPVRVRWWRVSAADVPRVPADQVDWLYTHWERADAWIAALGSEHG
ncbi:1-acyl-sn-glycerol-3-phosphate acyltransferase [Actinomadura roseirufa]|uniref:1-acyl-sn-glycerol-3-phosphate acyltransferase n=1 Tax=Actinomadura roseirufa TaxID=2094049 RepID=UPI0010418F95|nr:1-acyl-sn-glycerol-3-phosphate acyltransferase [Actinomadura roseirufa]